MSPDQLAEIKERADKATPGPWYWRGNTDTDDPRLVGGPGRHTVLVVMRRERTAGDTETTSLRHDRRAWEIAIITRDDNGKDEEHTWFIDSDDIDLGNADLMSLKIGKFFDRHPQARIFDGTEDPTEVSDFENESWALLQAEVLLRGATIVGAVPNFDTEVLANRMREHGICPSWRYHLIDVETLAAGALKLPPPWDFDKVLDAYGLTYDEADRHTALGDARMVRDLYDAVLSTEPKPESIVPNVEKR